MNRDGRLLIVFSKNPVAGLVKTRLAASIGPDEALRIYEQLREITEKESASAQCARAVFYSSHIPESDLFLDGGSAAFLQEGADLGERMHRAFLKGFDLGFRQVVLIGTDCPGVTTFLIDQAFGLLGGNDAVIGPACDGGFYLIGLNTPLPGLFLERGWSNSGVLAESLRILREHGLACALLPALSDIDTIDDLKESGLWDPN